VRDVKKIMALIMCTFYMLSGCMRSPAVPDEGTDEELIVVGVSQTGAESDWRVANSESIRSVFTEENGYRLMFDDARQKQENQITAVRKFIQQRVDYIVLIPLSELGWDSVLKEARDAGIPVIIADRMVQTEDKSLYVAHVGSDFIHEGEIASRWLEENTDGPLNILHVQGTPNSSAQLGRTKALQRAAERNGWEILAQLDGDFTRAKAYAVVRDYLSQQNTRPDIDVVYCENDNEAFGAMQALEEAGYVCGREDGIKVITFDATRACLEECLDGRISLVVECNPLLGPKIEETIQCLERGDTPKKEQYAEEQCFTREMLSWKFINGRDY